MYVLIILSMFWYDDVIKMSLLCEGVRLCSRCNNIRLVMNCLCALLGYDDDNVFLSHMWFVFKRYSRPIPNEVMILIYNGLVS